MGLEDTATIDIAIRPPGGRGLDLIILDSGEVSDELRRYQLVQEKLITYVEYVATGQYREQAADVARDDVTIRIICTTPPNDVMKQVVSVVSRQQPEVRIPVIVEMEQEFLNRTRTAQRAPSNASKPWWKFW